MRTSPPQPGPRARAQAQAIHRRLEEIATTSAAPSELAQDELFAAIDRFHALLFEESGVVPSCGIGCSSCCSQAVFDVHAFEVVRIGRALVEEGTAPSVAAALRVRNEVYDSVRREHCRRPGESLDDWTERVAIEFWKLDLPCALLRDDRTCSIHALRPWSCRRYFSLSDPQWCRGEAALDPRREGWIAEPAESTDELLTALDRHVDFEAETDRLDLALERWLKSRGYFDRTTLPVSRTPSPADAT